MFVSDITQIKTGMILEQHCRDYDFKFLIEVSRIEDGHVYGNYHRLDHDPLEKADIKTKVKFMEETKNPRGESRNPFRLNEFIILNSKKITNWREELKWFTFQK